MNQTNIPPVGSSPFDREKAAGSVLGGAFMGAAIGGPSGAFIGALIGGIVSGAAGCFAGRKDTSEENKKGRTVDE